MAADGYGELVRFVATALAVIAILLTVKLGAWVITGSLALLVLVLDTGLDAHAALGAYFATKVSSLPPDSDHAYGHWKAECIGALAISLIVVGTYATLVYTSAADLFAGRARLREGWYAVAAILGSLITKLAISKRLAELTARYSSQTADALTFHLKSDVATYSAATAAALLADYGVGYMDALAALVAAIYYAALGLRKALLSINDLMDTAPPGLTETVVKSYHPSRASSQCLPSERGARALACPSTLR